MIQIYQFCYIGAVISAVNADLTAFSEFSKTHGPSLTASETLLVVFKSKCQQNFIKNHFSIQMMYFEFYRLC